MIIRMAEYDDIKNIAHLRSEMQIEDWQNTLNKDYSPLKNEFVELTANYLIEKLNSTIFFSLLYQNNELISMCAIEINDTLPQITICENSFVKQCSIVCVYTKPEFRDKGFQQDCFKNLMEFAHNNNFKDITLTTNSQTAIHIYEKFNFKKISEKYLLI